jgi:hypothetical protein
MRVDVGKYDQEVSFRVLQKKQLKACLQALKS